MRVVLGAVGAARADVDGAEGRAMSERRTRPIDPARLQKLNAEGRRLLWDAINRYARAAGGDPSARSYRSRKAAIVDIEAMLVGTLYEKPREQEAPGTAGRK